MDTPPPFRILMVCTGNICRSPMAERLLQQGLDSTSPNIFEVSSAGTRALVGRNFEPQVAETIRVMGGEIHNFSARQLTPNLLEQQDLILGMTRDHRSRIVEMKPSMLKKAFTLRELAALLPAISISTSLPPAQRWEKMIALAIRARGTRRVMPHDDDVVDPYKQSHEIYDQMYRQTVPAVMNLTAWNKGKIV